MQDNLIDIVNQTYEYPNNECLQLASRYRECLCSSLFKSKEEKKRKCDEYLNKFLRCKTSQKELLIHKSER